jgi:hypothetical protein
MFARLDAGASARVYESFALRASSSRAFAIRRILDHPGLSAPAGKPPAPREILRVTEQCAAGPLGMAGR